ncbi:hypothetical protein JX266_008799 [Neoarthrinium moseri]|nr:hypothetical protein JX266_008799 [Neoarthrinium moseri]
MNTHLYTPHTPNYSDGLSIQQQSDQNSTLLYSTTPTTSLLPPSENSRTHLFNLEATSRHLAQLLNDHATQVMAGYFILTLSQCLCLLILPFTTALPAYLLLLCASSLDEPDLDADEGDFDAVLCSSSNTTAKAEQAAQPYTYQHHHHHHRRRAQQPSALNRTRSELSLHGSATAALRLGLGASGFAHPRRAVFEGLGAGGI